MGPGPALVQASYSLDEIPTTFGEMTARASPANGARRRGGARESVQGSPRGGAPPIRLEKSEKGYSPTTRYTDYAISPELFHWESQSMTSKASPTGQRSINHLERGSNILLFVRRTAKLGTRTAPYIFLGFADQVSHERERPIGFVWRLQRPMPAEFFREAKVAAGWPLQNLRTPPLRTGADLSVLWSVQNGPWSSMIR